MTVGSQAPVPAGHLADNVAGFTALLRRAGMKLGFDATALAAEALALVDLRDRRQARAALSAALLHHHRDRQLFEAAFALFWRAPTGSFTAEQDASDEPHSQDDSARQTNLPKRLEDALRAPKAQSPVEQGVQSQIQASLASADERLRALDFAAMSSDELAAAERFIRRLGQQLKARPSRRFRATGAVPATGSARLDLRRSLNHLPRTGGDLQRLFWRRRIKRPDPLVILADVSGSMEAYIRPSLIFAHAMAQGFDAPSQAVPLETFVFATRLTCITRDLRRRDPDTALKAAVDRVQDWSGGTRLGEILRAFNRTYLRRVLSSGGTVLLISDGLERGSLSVLEQEVQRLARFSRLWWLNPLMRYDDYAPTAQGAAVLEAACARRLPAHSLDSLAALGEALAEL